MLATVDKYTGRLYKNTIEENVWFNHSYVYKAHHEEDGAETYKYTVGNIQDGSVHLVSRKGKNDITPVESRVNMAYYGTSVAGGNAIAVVVETGSETEIGHSSTLISQEGADELPVKSIFQR